MAAEDIVQDTFLKWMEVHTDEVKNKKAYLVKMVTNHCINYLNSTQFNREKYLNIFIIYTHDRHGFYFVTHEIEKLVKEITL